MKKHTSFSSCLLVAVLACLLAGCPSEKTPIAKALAYLQRTQVTADIHTPGHQDYAGDWPQFITPQGMPHTRVRDVSPFIPAFIHHGLTLITEDTVAALGLTAEDAIAARHLRQRTAAFVKRFEAEPDAPDAGTYGFWPLSAKAVQHDGPLANFCTDFFIGPVLSGSRFPVNISFYPSSLAFPTDSDDTAAAYLVMLNDALLDKGPGSDIAFEQFFADWRDLGQAPRRLNPPWLAPASGIFLTWLSYKQPPDLSIPNDIDATLNANVLHVLARYGRLATAGVPETIEFLNQVAAQGRYRTDYESIMPYYARQGYVFHFFVSRAYYEGPVPGLMAAVEVLADDIEQEALELPDGTVYWDKGSAHLDTAMALLSLMNAGRNSAVIDKGITWLIAQQDPVRGCWDEGVFFTGRTDNRMKFNWICRALTTAMAMQALCRYKLAQAQASQP